MNKATERALVEAHKAGLELARLSESRAYVNDVARTLPVEEADALLAGYYTAVYVKARDARDASRRKRALR